ncbi:hypothetical protein E2542_SST03249 [Spatholobus suberectus]|nr:hypothetical protein E2542_SST03249 [Spatholobus suberectus]
MIGEWNGDKLGADGAALSALEDDYREKGVGELYNGVCPTVKWEKLIRWFLDHVFLSCAFCIQSCFSILIICFSRSEPRKLNSNCSAPVLPCWDR